MPLNLEWTLTAGNLSHSDYGYIYFTPCIVCINSIQYGVDILQRLMCQSIIYLHVHSLHAVVLKEHFLAATVLQLMVQPSVIVCHGNVLP
jgi:hypothetical protein